MFTPRAALGFLTLKSMPYIKISDRLNGTAATAFQQPKNLGKEGLVIK